MSLNDISRIEIRFRTVLLFVFYKLKWHLIDIFSIVKTFRTVFWSVFGRGDTNMVQLGNYRNSFTEDIGYWIFGIYNAAMVIVLLNMLIAMMSRSFQNITVSSYDVKDVSKLLIFSYFRVKLLQNMWKLGGFPYTYRLEFFPWKSRFLNLKISTFQSFLVEFLIHKAL